MNFSRLPRKIRVSMLVLSGLGLILPLSSCAVFSHRAKQWEKTVTRDANGVLTHAQDRTWEGEGPGLLLIHGFADGPNLWKNLGPVLSEHGYHVRAMRLPGWNEPLEVKKSTHRDEWREEVINELADLQNRGQPVIILAHSLGACVVSDLLQSHAIEPDAVVLYAPLFKVSNRRSPLLETHTWYRIGRVILPEEFIIENLYNEQAISGPPRTKSDRDPFNPKPIFDQVFSLMEERAALPMNIDCPVMLVVTPHDKVIDTPTALGWMESLNAPQKTLREENQTGHAIPFELNPETETATLETWLKDLGLRL